MSAGIVLPHLIFLTTFKEFSGQPKIGCLPNFANGILFVGFRIIITITIITIILIIVMIVKTTTLM